MIKELADITFVTIIQISLLFVSRVWFDEDSKLSPRFIKLKGQFTFGLVVLVDAERKPLTRLYIIQYHNQI